MPVHLRINNSDDASADYIGWSPCPLEVWSDDGISREVILSNDDPNQGGQVVFMLTPQGPPEDSIRIDLSGDGRPANLYIAGKFDQENEVVRASTNDKDTVIAVTDAISSNKITEKKLMVRVRKNANLLTSQERDRFLSALVRLNSANEDGIIKFLDFQNMHTSATDPEIHQRSSFLPWHRAYLLDLERNLQAIDPSVALPYWKFDEAAPFVFTKDFVGRPLSSGLVDFSPTNPLINWRLQLFGVGNGRIRRIFPRISSTHVFDPALEPAYRVNNNEELTLRLGNDFSNFRSMEGDPHGMAHVSFIGQISDIGQAPADPLFFMLHCNVDRLWAKWQWVLEEDGYRFDPQDSRSYPRQGNGNPNIGGEWGIGNFTDDTMWPWNGVFKTGPGDPNPRPPSAPGGYFPDSPILDQPGNEPRVKNVIDYQGQLTLSSSLGFAYDDIPFDFNDRQFA